MKKFLVGIVVVFALIIIALVVVVSMVDLNKYKPQIEKAVKENSGYEMKINGDIATSFSPIGISISKVEIRNPQIMSNQKFFDMDKLSVAVELKPLMKKEIKVKYIVLNNLNLDIKKLKNGKFNFDLLKKETKAKKSEKIKEGKKAQLPMVSVKEVRIKNANISFQDLKTKSSAKVEKINIAVNNIKFDPSKKILQAISFDADTKIAQIVYDRYKLQDITVALNMKDAIATLNNMKLSAYGSSVTAKGKLNLNKKVPILDIVADIPKLNLENFSKEFLHKDILSGFVKVHKKFRLSLGDEKTIKRTLKGGFLIDGQGIGVKGFDLDKVLSTYNSSKKMDIKSLGSSLVSGPLNAMLSGKGLSSMVGGKNSGTTLLKRVYIKVNIARGTANLSDIAIATGKNRVALKGKLDILRDRFLGVQLGVLDAKNCAKLSQTIEGTFTKPKIKVNASTITSMVKTASSLLSSFGVKVPKMPAKKQGKCKVFYNGIVKQPK